MYLNDDEKKLISEEIKEVEKKSSAELVAVFSKISATYEFETLVLSLLFALLISILALFSDISKVEFFQIEVLSFLFFYFLINRYKTIVLLFLPKAYKYEKASSYAKEQFLTLGLNKTDTKQAIMFFVSQKEKYVEIITDKNIKTKIEDAYWQKIVDEFILDVKKGDFSQGYIKAIKACSSTLIENFPISNNDKNELTDEVIEL